MSKKRLDYRLDLCSRCKFTTKDEDEDDDKKKKFSRFKKDCKAFEKLVKDPKKYDAIHEAMTELTK